MDTDLRRVAEEALRIADAPRKGLDYYNRMAEHGEALARGYLALLAEHERVDAQRWNLYMLAKRLFFALRKHNPERELVKQAEEFLGRVGTECRDGILRQEALASGAPAPTVVADPRVPDDRVEFRQDGKLVGVIENVAKPAPEGGDKL